MPRGFWIGVAAMAALGLLAGVACSDAGAETPSSDDADLTGQGQERDDLSTPRPPDVYLETGGKSVTAALGSYLWRGVIADTFAVVTPAEAVAVQAGGQVTFRFPLDPAPETLTIRVLDVTGQAPQDRGAGRAAWTQVGGGESQDLPAGDEVAYTLDLGPGTYAIDLMAGYGGDGYAAYGFLIEVT